MSFMPSRGSRGEHTPGLAPQQTRPAASVSGGIKASIFPLVTQRGRSLGPATSRCAFAEVESVA